MERWQWISTSQAVFWWINREKHEMLFHYWIFWKRLIKERDATFTASIKPRKGMLFLLLCDLPCTWIVDFFSHNLYVMLEVIFHLSNNTLTNLLQVGLDRQPIRDQNFKRGISLRCRIWKAEVYLWVPSWRWLDHRRLTLRYWWTRHIWHPILPEELNVASGCVKQRRPRRQTVHPWWALSSHLSFQQS